MQACIGVDSDGRASGLALMWKDTLDIQLHSFSHHHMHVSIKPPTGTAWLFTEFYGHPNATRRKETWHLLRSLTPPVGVVWLVGGDFNEVLNNGEKSGGNQRSKQQMENFCVSLDQGKLQDLGFEGDSFTWCNGWCKLYSGASGLLFCK